MKQHYIIYCLDCNKILAKTKEKVNPGTVMYASNAMKCRALVTTIRDGYIMECKCGSQRNSNRAIKDKTWELAK